MTALRDLVHDVALTLFAGVLFVVVVRWLFKT